MCMKNSVDLSSSTANPKFNLRGNHPIAYSGKPNFGERERERETYHCVARTVFDEFTKLLDSVFYGPALHQALPTLVVDVTSDLSCDS